MFDSIISYLLWCCSCTEVNSVFIERTLIPTDETEVVSWTKEKWILFTPFQNMERNYSHSYLYCYCYKHQTKQTIILFELCSVIFLQSLPEEEEEEEEEEEDCLQPDLPQLSVSEEGNWGWSFRLLSAKSASEDICKLGLRCWVRSSLPGSSRSKVHRGVVRFSCWIQRKLQFVDRHLFTQCHFCNVEECFLVFSEIEVIALEYSSSFLDPSVVIF